ncbi:MAG: cytochrome d ubiquinol oxidase subunit II [Gammaproteobacteria bacterium]|jgi:cytochrome d ubiquinol oxidase subunit II|nr:cytochrome d ubiquinol oxidase subunit II [Gammaproteobacteria bacterium]
MEGGWLPLIWIVLIAVAIFMYVLLDGFVLGTGILFPFAPDDEARDTMMTSVAPIWDGNETWLVLGGGGLFAVFPLAYSIVLPALYLPFMFMLLALVFRGVAFEFRFKSGRNRHLWDIAFTGGSVVTAFFQGIILGTFVSGFAMEGTRYVGGTFDWLTPFGLIVGLAMVAGYALLGSTWLIMKAPGELEQWARRVTIPLLASVVVFLAVISMWVPFLENQIAERWFTLPNLFYLSPVPLLTAVAGYLLFRKTTGDGHASPFLLAIGLFTLGYAGLAISLWPNIIPHEISFWEAAAAPESQQFLLIGSLIALPAVFAYTAYSYYVFRGKVTETHSY